jgi:hypothetical protein
VVIFLVTTAEEPGFSKIVWWGYSLDQNGDRGGPIFAKTAKVGVEQDHMIAYHSKSLVGHPRNKKHHEIKGSVT